MQPLNYIYCIISNWTMLFYSNLFSLFMVDTLYILVIICIINNSTCTWNKFIRPILIRTRNPLWEVLSPKCLYIEILVPTLAITSTTLFSAPLWDCLKDCSEEKHQVQPYLLRVSVNYLDYICVLNLSTTCLFRFKFTFGIRAIVLD